MDFNWIFFKNLQSCYKWIQEEYLEKTSEVQTMDFLRIFSKDFQSHKKKKRFLWMFSRATKLKFLENFPTIFRNKKNLKVLKHFSRLFQTYNKWIYWKIFKDPWDTKWRIWKNILHWPSKTKKDMDFLNIFSKIFLTPQNIFL